MSWRLLARPHTSQAVLFDVDKSTASLNVDVQGEYQIELSGSLNEQFVADTNFVYAHDVTELGGTYHPLFEIDGYIDEFWVYQDKLYASGDLFSIDGEEAYGIAVYDGTGWSPLGSGLKEDRTIYGGMINDMIEYRGELYVTGEFGSPGGVKSPSIARWNGDQWIGVPGLDFIMIDGDWGAYIANSGRSFKIFQDELYITGDFRDGQGQSKDYSIMKWDGSQLTGVANTNLVSELELYDNNLYAVDAAYRLIAYDGSAWKTMAAVNKGAEFLPLDLVSYGENLLVSIANDTRGLQLFSWNGSHFLDSGKPVSRTPSVYPTALE